MPTYYVGSGGNDGNNGTSWATRKLTLNGVEDTPVVAGDIVYVGSGTYRETLTVDVSGTAGNVITYIGDYTGTNTDGVGGIVRITGSDNDTTITRSNAITCGAQRNYRTFQGLRIDLTSSHAVYSGSGIAGTNWIIDKCAIDAGYNAGAAAVCVDGANQATWTVQNCLIQATASNVAYMLYFLHSADVDSAGHVIQNCIIANNPYAQGMRIENIGGITLRNSVLHALNYGVAMTQVPGAGQVMTIYNCVIDQNINGLYAGGAGYITENYNALYGNNTARINVSVGANSNAYPPLFDARWFFQLVTEGAGPSSATQLVTPFDLASYSQLVNVAGTSPTTTDMRGTAVQGAQREWGVLEYDSTLKIEGSAAGGGAVSISPLRGNIG